MHTILLAEDDNDMRRFLVKAAIDGRLPRGLGIAGLRDAPAEWSQQLARLGLPHT